MARVSIRLSRSAAEKARKPDDVREAAFAAFERAGGGDILCAVFTANGQQFALSSRTVVDVEWLPNRIPDRVIRKASGTSLAPAGNTARRSPAPAQVTVRTGDRRGRRRSG